MKTSLRLLIISIIILISGNTNAQFFVEKQKYVTFQIRGGMNLSNVSAWKNEYGFKSGKVRFGYNFGGIADITLGNDVYLQTGLSFTTKGAKVNRLSTTMGNMEAKMEAMYIQLPIYFTYKFNFPNNTHFGFAMGPYVAYGVAGKTTLTTLDGTPESNKGNTFAGDRLWNRPDVGLGIELQAELSRFVFIIGSDTGFTRIWKREMLNDNLKVRNNSVYLSLGVKI